MDDPYLTYKEKICCSCINKDCSMQILKIHNKGLCVLRCVNYRKGNNIVHNYPLERTAKQLEPIMRLD